VRSDDEGVTFQNPESRTVLSESEGCIPRMETPSVVAGPNGAILSCWFFSPDVEFSETFDIKCKSSLDNGETFSDEITVVDDKIEMPFWKCPFLSYHRLIGAMSPYMEITPDGVAYMVYAADPTPGDFDAECGDVYYAKSIAAPWNEWTPTNLQPKVNDDETETFQGFATLHQSR